MNLCTSEQLHRSEGTVVVEVNLYFVSGAIASVRQPLTADSIFLYICAEAYHPASDLCYSYFIF